jgi:Flp pilus assembly pilin Flp
MNAWVRFQLDRRGQTVVEFAFIAPVLLAVIIAVLSFGLILSWQNQLNNAAREGARAGAVCKTKAEITSIVASNLTLIPHPETVLVTVTPRDANGGQLSSEDARQRGGSITVELTYLANVVPLPGILSPTRTMLGRSTFRMECDAAAP